MINSLKDRVEELVAREFIPTLLERAAQQHKKHAFKSGCDCFWCVNKRTLNYLYTYGMRQLEDGSLKQVAPPHIFTGYRYFQDGDRYGEVE